MSSTIGREAAIPNPLLAPFHRLVGTWATQGRHPYIPGTILHGRTSFEWIEGGAFLMIRSEIDEPGIPSGRAIIGGDDATGTLSMLYFDERSVAREYAVTMRDDVMTWSRNAPGFLQRMVFTFAADGRTIVAKGVMSKDGTAWEDDLELTYTRTD